MPRIIVCVECGGQAHLVHEPPVDDPPRTGDVVIYRCADCLERLDVVMTDDDAETDGAVDGFDEFDGFGGVR